MIDNFETWALYITCLLLTNGYDRLKVLLQNGYKKGLVLFNRKQDNGEGVRHMIIFLIMSKQIIEKIHKRFDESSKETQLMIEGYIPKHYDELFTEFQKIG